MKLQCNRIIFITFLWTSLGNCAVITITKYFGMEKNNKPWVAIEIVVVFSLCTKGGRLFPRLTLLNRVRRSVYTFEKPFCPKTQAESGYRRLRVNYRGTQHAILITLLNMNSLFCWLTWPWYKIYKYLFKGLLMGFVATEKKIPRIKTTKWWTTL